MFLTAHLKSYLCCWIAGVIGCGNIGKHVVKAAAFGTRILVNDVRTLDVKYWELNTRACFWERWRFAPLSFSARCLAHFNALLVLLVTGVVGCGNIGKHVVLKTAAFGTRILVNDVRTIDVEFLERYKAKQVPLEYLLRKSDYVSLNCDLNRTSRYLINKESTFFGNCFGQRHIEGERRGIFLIDFGLHDIVWFKVFQRQTWYLWAQLRALILTHGT